MIGWLIAAGLAQAVVVVPPPSHGTVAVIMATEAPDADADQPFIEAVGEALGQADFTLLPDHSRYVAEVSVARERKGTATMRVAKDAASAGIGSWGPTVRVPLGSKKTRLTDLVATTLTVRLVTRADRTPVWRGSALTVQADGAPVAAKLARAVVATWPQTLASPVSVP